MSDAQTRYTISTATSRYDKNYHAEQLTWEELCDRLAVSKETPETLEQYNRMLPEERGDVKDVGGFVGGEIMPDSRGHRRRVRGSVVSRQLLTIDVDHATRGGFFSFWSRWQYRALYYSTHSSMQYAERVRLVVPLSREVNAVEYEAVGRMICKDFAREVDESTYQMDRLMYYPSHPVDEVPLYEAKEGAILDVDDVLGVYDGDATNPANWVYGSPDAKQARLDARDFAGTLVDPRTKRGVIGAWCRVYSVRDVLDSILVDTYGRAGRRYKYLAGKGAPGVTIRDDDQYMYSHHSDDPASTSHALNSFDVVRVHRFGHLDSATDTRQRVTARPSYKAMADYAMQDSRVVYMLNKMQAEEIDAFDVERSDYPLIAVDAESSTSPSEDPAEDDAYKERLMAERLRILQGPPTMERTKTGDLVCNQANLLRVMQLDSRLATVKNDQFAGKWVVDGPVPWHRDGAMSGEWEESDDAGLRNYLEMYWGFRGVTKDRLSAAWAEVMQMQERQVHAIRDYLNGLTWDGVERLDYVFERALSVPESPLSRAIARKTLTAAVARAYEPGTKFDQITVLVGAQGIGKSSIIQILGKGYVNESLSFDAKSKDLMEQLRSVWLVEFSELEGMAKAEVTTLKSFLSRRFDTYRPAYGRYTITSPRQCVFFGTTNEEQFLRDTTGNRRFWVLQSKRGRADGWSEYLTRLCRDSHEVDQIWAEAVERYRAGETLYLDTEESAQLEETQQGNTIEDPTLGLIREYLDTKILSAHYWDKMTPDERREWYAGGIAEEMQPVELRLTRTEVTTVEILNECFGDRRWRDNIKYKSKYIGQYMDQICKEDGTWERSEDRGYFSQYGRQRYWRRVYNV